METIIRVKIQKYTTKELAKLNNTSRSTFNKDLKPYRSTLGKPRFGHRWSEEQVEMIFKFLGRAYEIIEIEKLPDNIRNIIENKTEEAA